MIQPFVNKESRKRRRSFARRASIIIAIFLMLCAGGVIYLVIFSSFPHVRIITVSGTEKIADDEIVSTVRAKVKEHTLVSWMGEDNIFLWPSGKVDIGYTAAQTVVVKRNFITRNVVIEVIERNYFGIACFMHEKCFWFDESGFLFEEAPHSEGAFILKVLDRERQSVEVGDFLMTPSLMENFRKIVDAMEKISIPSVNILFFPRLQEVHWKTFEGGDVFLSLRFDPSINIQALQKFRMQISLDKLRYVDLRVEERLYYKPL